MKPIIGIGLSIVFALSALSADRVTGPGPAKLPSAKTGKALYGAPDFYPTPEQPIGWRGDGSGYYPGAVNPPSVWSRKAVSITDKLLFSAARETGTQPGKGKPLTRTGVLCYPAEWLVLGPFSVPADARNIELEILPREKELMPSAGDKAGDKTWRLVATNSPNMSITAMVGGMASNQTAFLATYIFAPEDCEIPVTGRVAGHRSEDWIRIAVGDKFHDLAGEWRRYKLARGWNRLLVKVVSTGNKDANDFTFAFLPVNPRYEVKNVLWATPLPGTGYGIPTVVGNKVFILADPAYLVCCDKNTGKLIWARSSSIYEAAVFEKGEFAKNENAKNCAAKLDDLVKTFAANPVEDVTRAMNDNWQKILGESKSDPKYAFGGLGGWGGGNCASTVSSDGKNVFVYHGDHGIVASYDLEGNRRWTRFERTGGAHHGINATPLLLDDKVIILGKNLFLAYDKETGKELWRTPGSGRSYGSPVAARIGNKPAFVAPDGFVLMAGDGKTISGHHGNFDGECASAVVSGDKFYIVARAGAALMKLPAGDSGSVSPVKAQPPELFAPSEPYPVASPVLHEGLFYMSHSGWGRGDGQPYLYVMDATTLDLVYKQRLDEKVGLRAHLQYGADGAGLACSLTVAGRYLYLMDNCGKTLVIETGKVFKPVSLNHIQHMPWVWSTQEITEGTPSFDGSRIYYRGKNNLYCIGEK